VEVEEVGEEVRVLLVEVVVADLDSMCVSIHQL
jgi:hypothetical protein